MAKSGFVPAWMKLPSSDKINVTNRTEIDSKTSSSNLFAFRRSFSRERTNFYSENSSLNENQSENLKSQRRLHSVSSPISDQTSKSNGFDQDFPSLKSTSKFSSGDQEKTPSIWNNAASKLRSSTTDSFKLNHQNRFLKSPSNRSTTKKDRIFNTTNGSTSNQQKSIGLDFHANYITQTKNLDKRSDFFNSLKNHFIEKPREQISFDSKSKKPELTNRKNQENGRISKKIVLLLSVPESSEEKEFLKRMGWKESEQIDYEITDQDKEEYEKRLQLSPRTEHNRTTLMLALKRRALPSLNIDDLIQSEKIPATSDDESSDD